jgi:uncharacterized protein YdaU (DUF1376 family)
MSERPWMPLYIGDYQADTQHLSTYEHGAYLLLLMHHWQHDKLPGDDGQLSRIAKVHPPHWSRLKKVLMPFFDVQEDGSWTQKRTLKELIKAGEISNKRKEAAEQMHERRRANALQMHTQPQLQPHKERKYIKERNEVVREETAKTAETCFIEVGTPEWEAWSKVKRWPQTDRRANGTVKRGWWFRTEWPTCEFKSNANGSAPLARSEAIG